MDPTNINHENIRRVAAEGLPFAMMYKLLISPAMDEAYGPGCESAVRDMHIRGRLLTQEPFRKSPEWVDPLYPGGVSRGDGMEGILMIHDMMVPEKLRPEHSQIADAVARMEREPLYRMQIAEIYEIIYPALRWN